MHTRVTILNNAGKNLEKLLVSLYTFYFPSRLNIILKFFSQKTLKKIQDTKIQIELQEGNERFPFKSKLYYWKGAGSKCKYKRNEWKRRRIGHSRSNVRHARGVE